MADIILTEEQLGTIINLIRTSKKFLNENNEKKYDIGDLKRAFDAGQEWVWSDVEQTETSPKYDSFDEWFNQTLMEQTEPSDQSKQKLYIIATIAYKMWESMGDDENLEEWMTSKILQIEQSLVSVVKSYMHDEYDDKGMGKLDNDELIIGN